MCVRPFAIRAASTALLFALAACGTPGNTVSVNYVPSPMPSTGTAAGGPVAVTAQDGRGMDPHTVAVKFDAEGQEIGTIKSERTVSEIVRDALERELASRGFYSGSGGATIDVTVEAFLNRLHTGTFSGRSEVDMALTATVTGPTRERTYRRRVALKGEKPSARLTGGTNVGLALENGLSEIIADLMNDEAFLTAIGTASFRP